MASDPRMSGLLLDLQNGFFWGVLTALDGPTEEASTYPTRKPVFGYKSAFDQERHQARDWTREAFTAPELAELTDLTVDFALNPPAVKGKSGFLRGHSTLLRHMVDKPGSIFKDGVDEKGRKRLVNGAFWEELGDAAIPARVSNILLDHQESLDPAFAKQGIALYKRNRDANTAEAVKRNIDMDLFPEEALDRYVDFVAQVAAVKDEQGENAIDEATIDELLQPYMLAVLAPDEDDIYELRFGPHLDLETHATVTPLNGFNVRLANPLIQESLKRSPLNRIVVAERLGEILTSPDGRTDTALDVIAVLGEELGDRILRTVIRTERNTTEATYLRMAIEQSYSPLKDRALAILDGFSAKSPK